MSNSKDVVDAEFEEVDDQQSPPPPLPARSKFWPILVAVCLAGGAFAYFGRSTSPERPPVPPPPPAVDGWDGLIPCSDVHSLDASRHLSLSRDGQAEMATEEGTERKTASGNWRLDKTTNAYSVTIANQTSTYLILNSDGLPCMLIKGTMNAANLFESWFAMEPPTPHDYDPPPDDYGEYGGRYR